MTRGWRSRVEVVSLPSIWYSRTSGPGCSKPTPRQALPGGASTRCSAPSTCTVTVAPSTSMATGTGHAAGAASPSASTASANRPARTRGWRVRSLFGLGRSAHFDEFHPRGATARALARQDGVDHLVLAGQAAPGRGGLGFPRANSARFIGHRLALANSLQGAYPLHSACAFDRRRREEHVLDARLDSAHLIGAELPQPLQQTLYQVLGGRCARADANSQCTFEPAWIELGRVAQQVGPCARALGHLA